MRGECERSHRWRRGRKPFPVHNLLVLAQPEFYSPPVVNENPPTMTRDLMFSKKSVQKMGTDIGETFPTGSDGR